MTVLLARDSYPGIAPKLVRAAAAVLFRMESASLWDLAVAIGAPESAVQGAWEQLQAEGRIKSDDEGHWVPTESMHTLATARIGKSLDRKKADKLIEQMKGLAAAANALPIGDDHYYVTRLAVFGSYLDRSKSELGDLDIAWALAERPSTRRMFMHSMFYGTDPIAPTRALVRPKSPYVRLVEYGMLKSLGCPFEDFYSFELPQVDDEAYAQDQALRKQRRAAYHLLENGEKFAWPDRYRVHRFSSTWQGASTETWTRRCFAMDRENYETKSRRASQRIEFSAGSHDVRTIVFEIEGVEPMVIYPKRQARKKPTAPDSQ